MVDLLSSRVNGVAPPSEVLLDDDEVIVIVDDSSDITVLLKAYLSNNGLRSIAAATAADLFTAVAERQVALIVLDIELPDGNGCDIIPELITADPDLGIIMVTGTADLQVALDCLRSGADDYLTKPINVEQFHHTVIQTLRKRRLAIDNRVFQRQLELTALRTQFLHHLILKMNSAHLSARELEQVLQTILICITSAEGLKFNRAFLALFNEDGTLLRGELAIGPGNREDAVQVWNEMKRRNLRLQDLIDRGSAELAETDPVVNEIVRSLVIPTSQTTHPLIHAAQTRTSILVENGRAAVDIPAELIRTLGEDSFVIVPLYSSSRALGVIIADNFVTGQPIRGEDVEALEILAGQASLAIEHSRLYDDMQGKIDELESVTSELERSKDLLVEAERYSALGQMSAQLVHALRNPITSIGGTARLLNKRISAAKDRQFLNVLTRESAKVESTLNDLFNFVSDSAVETTVQPLFPLVRRSVMVFYATMKKQGIEYDIGFDGDGPPVDIDAEKICQVFLHLIRNSIESMADGGRLKLTAEQQDGTVRILISDTGAGLQNGDIDRVTDPFYTTKTYGTGMGLTLVEQILTQHGADFSLTPNSDRGMTAAVTFTTV